MNWVIITAGGNGERMRLGINKIFARICDQPLIYWAIKVFEENKSIHKILITARLNDIPKIQKIIKKNKFKKAQNIISAENTRQESTFKILKWLRPHISNDDLVGIHNAVNPFVSQKEIREVYNEAKKYGAALLAFPAKDTIKISDDKGFVFQTPLREGCYYAQTPQVATFYNLWRAFAEADAYKFIGTDDTQLLERVGIQAKIIPCSRYNFKITFPEDLMVAEQILKVYFKYG